MQALMGERYGKTRSPQWPFCHSTSISSSYDRDPSLCAPMSWCVVIGTQEWGLFNIGSMAVKRTAELYQATAKGGSPDIRFFVSGKGHTISDQDLAASAASFAISDLAYSAFIYAPDYPDNDLRTIVEQANHQQPAAAQADLGKLLARPALPEPVRIRAQGLRALIDRRLASVAAMAAELMTSDPALATWYCPLLIAQLKGDAREKALSTALLAAGKGKDFQGALIAQAEFARQFGTLFGPTAGNPGVVADKRPLLTMLAPHLPATSRAGIVIADLLSLTK